MALTITPMSHATAELYKARHNKPLVNCSAGPDSEARFPWKYLCA